MNLKQKIAFWLVALGYVSSVQALQLWSLAEGETVVEHRNRRLEAFEGNKFLEMNLSMRELKAELEKTSTVEVELPTGLVSCKVKSGNPLVPDALAAKFPELGFFSGTCDGEAELSLLINEEAEDGFSASVTSAGKNFYIDSAQVKSNKYVMYNTKDAREYLVKTGQYQMEDEVIINEEFLATFEKNRKLRSESSKAELLETATQHFSEKARSLQSGHQGYKFKLAILTSRQYSNYHGNTRTSVFSALTTMMSRVNGIYMREFGTFMEFVDDQDEAICLNGNAETGTRRTICSGVPNTSAVLNSGQGLLTDLGISSASYDIGHSVTTASGGVAGYPALCTTSKARGTTGLSSPENDIFAVDYVSHEIGHQFFGAHSFRDCSGSRDGNLMSEGAAEPGGGTSIMGYAGICGGNNIQSFSDPYFNSAQLLPMYDYIQSVAEDGCGETYSLASVVSDFNTASSCTVPLGNNFQLTASGITGDGFYSWDRVDLGYEDLDSNTLGRFRSWKPTKSVSRFFPNLHFLTFPATSSRDWEELPTNARSMTFRFTERSEYDTTQTEDEFDVGLLGEFKTADTTVSFTGNLDALEITSFTSGTVQAGSSYQLNYDADSSVGTVEFLVAENTLQAVSAFDYEDDIEELNWEAAGTGSNGSGTVTIPSSFSGPIAVMVKVGSDLCFYFDVVTGLTAV